MSENKKSELQRLIILIILYLLLSNGRIAIQLQKIVFANITWEQIILGLLLFRIFYILLAEPFLRNKR